MARGRTDGRGWGNSNLSGIQNPGSGSGVTPPGSTTGTGSTTTTGGSSTGGGVKYGVPIPGPGGSTRIYHQGGGYTDTYPDGTVTHMSSGGTETITYPNGESVGVAPGQSLTDPALHVSNAPMSVAQKTLLEKLTRILEEAGFTPEAVTDLINNVIKDGLTKGLSEYEILKNLRKSKTYKDFFPEYQNRIDNGWTPWDEADILRYRNDARAAVKSLYGIDITGKETAALISNNVSIDEFTNRVQTFKKMEELGGPVSTFFQKALGIKLGDQDLYEFFDPTIQSELNEAYENAYYSEYGAQIGLERGATATELAEFRKKGISVEQATQNYQQIRNAIPSLDRLAAIDAAVRDDKENQFDSLGQAMKAMQFMDTDAQQNIGRLIANEVARWSSSGGAAWSGTRAAGLQTSSQRARG